MEIKFKVKTILFFLFVLQVINVDGQNYIQTTTSNPGTIDIVHDGNINAKNLLIYRGAISSTELDSMRTIGLYRVSYVGSHSEALLDINGFTGSTPRFQLKANYDESLYFRAARDNEANWDNKGFREIIMANENGNVGIGTSNPMERLSLFSSSNDIASFHRINWNSIDRFKFTLSGNPANECFNFVWNNGSDNYLLSILSSGKVGVGTVSPGNTFQVSGTVGIGTSYTGGLLNFQGNSMTTLISSTRSDNTQQGNISFDGWGSYAITKKLAVGSLTSLTGTTATLFVDGNVGIGTTNPMERLSLFNDNNDIASFRRTNWSNTDRFKFALTGNQASERFNLVWGSGSDNYLLSILSNGNVGIGTTSPQYKLDVIGTIRAREIKVDLNGADFVFGENYKLKSLNDVEQYIKENKHLPGIESAEKMEADGTDLGALNTKLLQKVEELTLYTISQQKEIDELKKQNKEIDALKKMLELQSEKIAEILANTK